jgi:hypothetical protein
LEWEGAARPVMPHEIAELLDMEPPEEPDASQ